MQTPLEESVLEELTEKLSYVKDFTVASMCWKGSSVVRAQFVQFASMVIELH